MKRYVAVIDEIGLAVLQAGKHSVDVIRIPESAIERPKPAKVPDGRDTIDSALRLPNTITSILLDYRVVTLEDLYSQGKDGLLKMARMGQGKVDRICNALVEAGLEPLP